MTTKIERIKEGISRDMMPFCDPGTLLNWSQSSTALQATWSVRGQSNSARFQLAADGSLRVFAPNELSYNSFLSSPSMGDLHALAKMILQSTSDEFYIATRAETMGDGPETGPALELIQRHLAQADTGTTKIVFVTAEAGAGKTRILRKMVRDQASQYLLGATDRVFLYINAQGRALARFEEALATELQDLRARLTYHAIPALVRNGLLVPVIDGFDELLGTAGYEDAFGSLKRFIEELSSRGEIVASARSAYYEQEFIQRAYSMKDEQAWELVPIRVLPWDDQEFDAYIRNKSTGHSPDFGAKMRSVFAVGANKILRDKPLFVARAAALLDRGVVVDSDRDLVEQLVASYLDRERTEKLLDKNGAPLMSLEQLIGLMVLIAEEMWIQETRELDIRSMKEVAEVAAAGYSLSAAASNVLIQRVGSLAFLQIGRSPDRVEFEHEVFFAYFLARRVAELALSNGPLLAGILCRSALPPACAGLALRQIKTAGGDFERVLQTVTTSIESDQVRFPQIQVNAGALVVAAMATLLPNRTCTAQTLRRLVIADEDLSEMKFVDCIFDRVEFRMSDLSSTSIVNSTASHVVLQEVLVDGARTRLELRGLTADDVFGICERVDNRIETRFNPGSVLRILAACGVPQINTVQPRAIDGAIVELVESLVRAFSRSTIIWVGDDRHARMASDPNWEFVTKLLKETRLVVEEKREKKGADRPGLRRNFLPVQLLAGLEKGAQVPADVRAFWDAVETRTSAPN